MLNSMKDNVDESIPALENDFAALQVKSEL